MKFIFNKRTDSYYNLASEEYLIKNCDDDIFMLWQNDNTIVIGRNQNTLAEINYDYVKENDIKVVRRMSGGGAVFHDMGNINFTFIINSSGDFSNYEKFTSPIIDFLATLGVKAELKGRNDLVIDGKKISGNAQFMYKNRILHHGTLLFSACEDKLSSALRVSEDKIKTKGIKSIRSRVTNISEYLKTPMTPADFMDKFSEYITSTLDDCVLYDLEQDYDAIKKLRDEKYSRWEWNFGYSPKYDYKKNKHFDSGNVEVCMNVSDNGIITDVKIYGDFFSKNGIDALEEKLKGNHHEASEIKAVLDSLCVSDYISGLNADDFLSVLF